jgi:putative MATE family efflux protein
MPASAARRAGPDGLLAMSPLRAILELAAPTTVVMLVAAVSNTLSTWYVSRLGADAIAAVSLVFPLSLLATTAMAGGIGAGASSAVARALGAGRHAAARQVAGHAIVLGVLAGVLFAAIILAGAPTLFRWMGAGGAVLESATLFARVLFGGAAITFLGAMLDSVLRGEGNVRVPAIWSSTSLLLQMVVTPFVMFTTGFGLVGAAIAPLACQLVTTVPRARFVFGGGSVLRPGIGTPSLEPAREILRVGVPAALATSLSNLGIMVMTGVLARLGDVDLAAYGLGTRCDFLLLSFAYGVSAAMLTLVGMASGARRPDLVRGFVLRACAIIVVLLALPGLLLSWRPELWIGLFTSDPGILAVGASYFRLIGPSYPFVGVAMVSAFAFQGLGRATTPLVWMAFRVAGVLAVALACTQLLGLGERAVFAAIAGGNVVSALVMAGLLARTVRRLEGSGRAAARVEAA